MNKYNGEYNTVTVDKIIMLMEEIAIIKSRFQEHDTGNLRTTVNVLEDRVKELKDRIHD
tara:strand:+ start:199 stop:375 length:177 start_codon:yes stop_codon:yes gene_type:complete